MRFYASTGTVRLWRLCDRFTVTIRATDVDKSAESRCAVEKSGARLATKMTGIDAAAPRPRAQRPRDGRVRVTLPASRGGLAWLLVLVLVAGFVVFQVGRQVYASWAIGQEADAIRAQIAAVEAQNDQYRQELSYLQSDAYISAEARRLQNLGRAGEQVLIIPPGAQAAPPAELESAEDASTPLLQQWLQLFFGR